MPDTMASTENTQGLDKQTRIAFIGGGNMARAIFAGLLEKGHPAEHIQVYAPGEKTRHEIYTSFDIKTAANNREALNFADVIIIAVKPHIVADVCADLTEQHSTKPQQLVLSVAAGVTIPYLSEKLMGSQRVIRTMPNLPSAIGEGICGLCADAASEADKAIADNIMSMVGKTAWVNESHMHAVVAAAGSSPAYLLLFLEAMERCARAQGLDDDVANELVLQSAYGAIALAKQSDLSLSELRQQVMSPGGTTERAVNTLINGNLGRLVDDAMQAAAKRSQELALT